jgi:NADP-dependent 3-hydroxy acid dehydrogenase YdfG
MVAWITGASKGIGRAIALRLGASGYQIAVSGRDQDALEQVAREIASRGGHALPFISDVRDEQSVQKAYRSIADALGEIDVLVNNAGTTVFKPFLSTSSEDFERLASTNLFGPFYSVKAVLPVMLERRSGSIVMINSMAAREVFSNSSVYAATKAGLRAMTDCLRLEVRKEGIRVISIYPGATDTDIWPDRVREKHRATMMTADDVAEQVAHALAMPSHMLVEDIVVQPIGGAL